MQPITNAMFPDLGAQQIERIKLVDLFGWCLVIIMFALLRSYLVVVSLSVYAWIYYHRSTACNQILLAFSCNHKSLLLKFRILFYSVWLSSKHYFKTKLQIISDSYQNTEIWLITTIFCSQNVKKKSKFSI